MKLITHPYSNSKSGILGVCRTTPIRGSAYWQANAPGGPYGLDPYWCKRFYVDGLGEHQAQSMAEDFRKQWRSAMMANELDGFWDLVGTERYVHGDKP